MSAMKTVLRRAAKAAIGLLPAQSKDMLLQRYYQWRDSRALRAGIRYDLSNYLTGSGLLRQYQHRSSLEAGLIKAYHRIEKGLALREPRPGFGRDAVDTLLRDGEKFLQLHGPSTTLVRVVQALDEYVAFNRGHGVDLAWLLPRLEAMRQALQAGNCWRAAPVEAGTRLVRRDDIHAAAKHDLSAFFAQRYSVRQFAPEPVQAELIEQAVRMAQKTPSVCNRESGTVFVVTDRARMAELMALQNGNRGFGDQAGALMIITSRQDTFLSAGERYQAWIDGGLFAMSLIYALHSLGLGTCCLNWSVEPQADRALKSASGIPTDHAVIMMLALGHLPEEFRVANSPRRPLTEVLHYL
ncbi:nitroreductase family protein [Roseateles toxinivorans]|uniref:Nitroreductase n=1 Tax=Roseateles toxinivorans TaxID=270368 RepID=A0A4R6QIZ1_9BURK|nr:nitroreductase family protein [Roseateles toxinivorans]TDP63344.1 nitroreductase [Roseateles toxinivorans]